MRPEEAKSVAERLKAAALLYENKLYADSVSRSFRALKEFAVIALGHEGVTAVSEDDALNRFRLYFLKTGGVDEELYRSFSRVRDLGLASESPLPQITEEEAVFVKSWVTKVVQQVRNYQRHRGAGGAREIAVGAEEGAAPAAAEAQGAAAFAANVADASSLPPEQRTALEDLYAHFKGDRQGIARYINEHGLERVNAAKVTAIKRALAAERAAAGSEKAALPDGKRHPVYFRVDVECPFCQKRFGAFMLRSKALMVAYRYKHPDFPFLVEEAVHPQEGYEPDDPLRYAAHVCPHCLYASLSASSFKSDSNFTQGKGLLSKAFGGKWDRLVAQMEKEKAERRRHLAAVFGSEDPAVIESKLTVSRDMTGAIAALELAGRCAALETELLPENIYRAAVAMLSAARISASLARGEDEQMYLNRAMTYYRHGFETIGPNGMILYQAGVLSYYLGDVPEARRLLGTVTTDRGKFPDAVKYKRWAKNLLERIKSEMERGEV